MEHFNLSQSSMIDLLLRIDNIETIRAAQDLMLGNTNSIKGCEWFTPIGHNTYASTTCRGNILIIKEAMDRSYDIWCTGGDILEWLYDLSDAEESYELPEEGEDVLSLLDETE